MACSDRRRGNGQRTETQEMFALYIRKYIFTVRVTEHWIRFPTKVVESPILERFKSHLDVFLGNWL